MWLFKAILTHYFQMECSEREYLFQTSLIPWYSLQIRSQFFINGLAP